MKNNRTRGYDLATKVPRYNVPVLVTLREGLGLEYMIEDQEIKTLFIRERQDNIPRNKRSLIGFITECYDSSADDPEIEFMTADGFLVKDLRCSKVIDYKVFVEDQNYRK